ncbi:MAG: AAA family ATPase [Oscillospiraceae bacterium]
MSTQFQNQYLMSALASEIAKVIKGKDDALLIVLTALLAQGHVLIEDVPGVGKTTLAMALGKASGLQFRRAQFTPDVMASDITGFTVYNKAEGEFEYREGMVMTNILLADEINRTSPKTQSALLEAMEENRVTVDGVVHKLPEPFMVIATQNSQSFVGTFPLPEAQLDRFMMKISMGYPTIADETRIILDRLHNNPVENVRNIMSLDQLMGCIDDVSHINFADSLCKYVAELAAATRNHPAVALGVSPRASVAIMQAARAFAYLLGRDYVIPEDIVRLMIPVFEHRIVLRQETRLSKKTVRSVLEDVVSQVTPPLKRS